PPRPPPLSLHDALPISAAVEDGQAVGDGEELIQALRDEDDRGSRRPELEQDAMQGRGGLDVQAASRMHGDQDPWPAEGLPAEERSEEHTSELQSRFDLV